MKLEKLAVVLACVLAAGCSSAPEEERASSSSADTSNRGAEFVAVPLTGAGGGYVPYLRSFPTYYLNRALRQACGGDYSIDLTVEFGEVTPTSMRVNAVLVYYHAPQGVDIVPTTMDVYSKAGTNVRKNDEFILGRHDGDSHRYEINKTYPVGSSNALIVEFHTAAGLPSGDSSDFACGQLAQIAYYPEGS